jgi:A/G-specific adenine glycosylase
LAGKPKTKIANPADIRRRLSTWFRENGRDLPWRRDPSPYAVIVSEFMLQQTQVATVIPYFERWMRRFPSFTDLAAATENDVLSLWQGLGYYSRARRLHEVARLVAGHFGGDLPSDLETISSLPGVGPYTAGAIAAFAFDRATPTIDGNIARVLTRLANLQEPIDSAEGKKSLHQAAVELLPDRGGRLHTSALMELGALICTARSPKCLVCPVRTDCATPEPESLPRKRARPPTIALDETCSWIVARDRILLEWQSGPRWRGLWKLPRNANSPTGEPLFRSTYPFTNHRVTLRVHPGTPPKAPSPRLEWHPLSNIESIPLAAPHRRAIMHLLEHVTPQARS